MVWTHTPPQQMPTIVLWLGRLMARLRAAVTPTPDRTSHWPAAVLAASAGQEATAESPRSRDSGRIGVTRVVPFQGMPGADQTAKAPTITPLAALTAATVAAPAIPEPPLAPRFHSLDPESISVVYVLSHRFGSSLACLGWLADHGMPFRRIGSINPTSPVWSAPDGALVLVDLDTLGGISEMAEPLMRLRLGRPDIAVILLSEEIDTHDFGTERLVLADITLRLPCAFASFEFALAEAPINNAAWQERLLGDHA